ncbi:hypothetical protein BRCON_1778 [Candidatus Sumerlaea chitinivorans]|uniref:Uncharacterized protein n=1 Tax=Sumerlaea chitinivorans TaxID=2250252 RepID=A0A2Z4Y804_SUMC1|nr:hypothetical protein BRCON_1778 [Candidatus Sumerlaea chitinivorans]
MTPRKNAPSIQQDGEMRVEFDEARKEFCPVRSGTIVLQPVLQTRTALP